jgi:hypothetical protein
VDEQFLAGDVARTAEREQCHGMGNRVREPAEWKAKHFVAFLAHR